MVKLPRSSKVPGLPKPSTAPPGPLPGIFCHSRGASSAVEDEQRERRTAATTIGTRRREVIFVLAASVPGAAGRARRVHRDAAVEGGGTGIAEAAGEGTGHQGAQAVGARRQYGRV